MDFKITINKYSLSAYFTLRPWISAMGNINSYSQELQAQMGRWNRWTQSCNPREHHICSIRGGERQCWAVSKDSAKKSLERLTQMDGLSKTGKYKPRFNLNSLWTKYNFPAIVAKQFLGQRSTGGHIGQQGLTQVLDTISLAADLVSSVQMRVRTWVTAQRMEEKKWTWERRKHLGGIISAWIPRVGEMGKSKEEAKGKRCCD